MYILTNENTIFDLNQVRSVLNDSVHFSVFDFSDKNNPDYFFRPLVMTETFNDAAIEFSIGNYSIKIPCEWSILLGDPETGDVELVQVHEINTRNFCALTYNPIKGIMQKFMPITPKNVYTEVYWTVPKINPQNFLLVPINNNASPDCIFIINEPQQKKLGKFNLESFI